MTCETEAELREEVTHLGEIIAGLVGIDDPTVEGLTKPMSRIYHVLENAEGRTVRRESLRRAVYIDRLIDDEPASRVVDNFICRMRTRRPDISARLFAVRGIGYRLVAA